MWKDVDQAWGAVADVYNTNKHSLFAPLLSCRRCTTRADPLSLPFYQTPRTVDQVSLVAVIL